MWICNGWAGLGTEGAQLPKCGTYASQSSLLGSDGTINGQSGATRKRREFFVVQLTWLERMQIPHRGVFPER
jgi:hypothetical protein